MPISVNRTWLGLGCLPFADFLAGWWGGAGELGAWGRGCG